MRCRLAQLSRHGSDELGLTQTANISPTNRPQTTSAGAASAAGNSDRPCRNGQNGGQTEAIAMVVMDNGKGSNGSVIKAEVQNANLNEIRPMNARVQVSHV